MEYQALYRKWRPRTFDDVVGQGHITLTLKRQIASDRLSHAYLFVGTRGTGKTTCAKILSRAANCLDPEEGNPCNRCPSCVGIESGSILDVEELDAASNNGVDNIRALRDEAVYSPAAVKKRVYIVDEVHMLSQSAFNALLKILEEPPPHLIFILATTEVHKIPATILSRCQRFSFRRITAADIAGRLEYVAAQENISLTKDASELLSRMAEGSMRDGLSLLDQCSGSGAIDVEKVNKTLGLAGTLETERLLDFIIKSDIPSALLKLDELYTGGKSLSAILDELMTLQRDILISGVAGSGGASLLSGRFGGDVLAGFSKRVPQARLIAGIQEIQSALSDMSRFSDVRTSAELCIIKLCDESLSHDVAALRSRVSRLEKDFASGIAPAAERPDSMSDIHIPRGEAPSERAPAEDKLQFTGRSGAEDFPVEEEPPAKDPVPPGMSGISDSAAWREILGGVKEQLDIPVYQFLSDTSHSSVELSGDTLTIKTTSPIAMGMINNANVTSILKSVSESILGRPVSVKVTEAGGGPELNVDKLDALSKFNNIKFK